MICFLIIFKPRQSSLLLLLSLQYSPSIPPPVFQSELHPLLVLNMATTHGSTFSIVPSEIFRQVARSLVSKDERYIAVQAITTKANVVASYRSSQR